jgi:transposase
MTYYVGVDYHKKYSTATVMNEKEEMLAQDDLPNTLAAFRAFLSPFQPAVAAVEATRNWSVAVNILEQLVDDVRLAHPADTKVIVKRLSTDKIDSRGLSRLLVHDWLPEAYPRDKPNRDSQAILRMRSFFVQQRTRIKNRVHDLIDRQAEPIREQTRTYSDLFGNKGMTWLKSLELPVPYHKLLGQLLANLDNLNAQIRTSDKLVKELLAADSEAQLISTIPGFGPFFSVLVRVEIDKVERFPDADRLCSYAGVVPWTESSGGKVWHGSLIKQSNRWLRWAFVEAAMPATVGDAGLRKLYKQYCHLKGPKIAKVIVARRLARILYQVLKQKRAYYPSPVAEEPKAKER